MKKALLGAALVVAIAAIGEVIYNLGFDGDTDFAITIFVGLVALTVAVTSSRLAKHTLFAAIAAGDEEKVLRMLGPLDRVGAFLELEVRNPQGQTPLAAAAEKGLTRVVERLIERGSKVDSQSRDGSTPLLFGIRSGRTVIAHRLIEAGANVSLADAEGSSPLMEAAFLGQKSVIEELLVQGADPKRADKSGKTPADWAKMNKQMEVVRYLETYPPTRESGPV